MSKENGFHQQIRKELDSFLEQEKAKYPANECLRIDLHVHDHNSNVPDELLARILNIPETWLPTEKLLAILEANHCNAFTVTNHNNARTCYELQDKGVDVLVGAEFTVKVPDFRSRIHVLAYGFSPEQEAKLDKLRTNVYDFQNYANEHDIPTVWAHPLFHYSSDDIPSMNLFEKLSLVFKRYETMNGQRDTWQNMLVKKWVQSLTPEKIDNYAKKYGIKPDTFMNDPYTRYLTGGSDEHMGIFSGQTGTALYVENLAEKLKTANKSDLALDAIRNGRMAVYGTHHDSEKMMMAFLDLFCQIGIHMKDPGLVRVLLHKGTVRDKVLAMSIINGYMEVRRHRFTRLFLRTFHRCLLGEGPGFIKKLLIPRPYKPIFKEVTTIAEVFHSPADIRADQYKDCIDRIFDHLMDLIITKVRAKIAMLPSKPQIDFSKSIMEMDLPAHFRPLFGLNPAKRKKTPETVTVGKFLDGLSFPFLGAGVVCAARFASANVLYKSRDLLDLFATETDALRHPKRMLWLTDTFGDKNGVAVVLKSILDEIRRRDLPIDMLVCSDSVEPGPNLIVVKPKIEFVLPFYQHQPIRVPNILQIHRIFGEGEYDRVICSTEGFMGAAVLFLKKAYSVPAYFYIHTDWITFSKKVLKLTKPARDRVKRFLRAYYRQFDRLFVLNTDQEKWLRSEKMGFSQDRVSLTAHWVEHDWRPTTATKKVVFGLDNATPVMLFTGRLSEEKGATEIPRIYNRVKTQIPGLRVVFAGVGPAEEQLKEQLPDAIFLGWVDHSRLPDVYSAADVMILPSKFDTFGCVVLESLSCGTPVIAYAIKGPKDIIEHGKCGFLADKKDDIAGCVEEFFSDKRQIAEMSKNAVKRAEVYNAKDIFDRFLDNVSLLSEVDDKDSVKASYQG